MFRALKSRNYRLYFLGQSCSFIGTWMQKVAMSWLVYRITNSPFFLGVAEFSSQFSAFLTMPFSGALLDRWDLRKALLATQVLGFVQALLLGLLTLFEQISFAGIIFFSVFIGVINAFDMPGRHSFAVQIVDDKDDLGNAIALNSGMFNLARLLGPAIAGIAINTFGEGFCFILNAITFIPIIIVMTLIIPKTIEKKRSNSIFSEIKEGMDYALTIRAITSVLLLVSLISLLGMPYIVLMPIFAKEILKGDSATLGFLMGSSGLGALSGALFVASRPGIEGIGQLIPSAFMGFSIGLFLFSFSRSFPVSIAIIALTGFFMIVGWSLSNTLLQSIVSDDKRSRIMSIYLMSFMGATPIGSLVAGGLATQIGVSKTLLFCSIACFTGSFFLRKRIHSISAGTEISYSTQISGASSASALQ